ncbi:MAG: hypothetical protein WC373_08840, partial [Smithella sp.]
MQKIKWNLFFGILVTLAFFSFLMIRLEFFSPQSEPVTNIQISKDQNSRETWMNIYQNNQKIGFIHRTFNNAEGAFHFNESVFMEINMMGITQAVNITTDGDLNPDMTLDSFKFSLNSGIFNLSAHGHVNKNKLILFTGSSDQQEKLEIPLKDIPHISGGIYEAAFQANLKNNATRSFSIFDPLTMSIQSIKVSRNADEIISVMGKRVLTKKYCTDFMGAKHCAWVDKEGSVLKETGIIGLSIEKTSKENALEGIVHGASVDFTQISSIPSNVEITEPEKLKEIKLNISGTNNRLLLNGDRQSYNRNTLTITKENLAPFSNLNAPLPAQISFFLKPSPLIQSNDPLIKTQAGKIINPTDSTEQKARKIISWVYRNIKKKPTLSVPNALEVLK